MPAGVASGGCLCGGVRYSVNGALRDVLQCHCARCRKVTGNFMAASGALLADLDFENDDTLRWFSPDDDHNVAYGFCRRCGSSLFWRVVDGRDPHPFVSICAGSLDTSPRLRTTAIWFADQAAAHTFLDPTVDHLESGDR